ncbi:hypothetical protein PR048_022767 [Dryococelus australis]|uniref:Uncharacterized protein n=1 Tax=Dryococelus australis TaxID=614101 RepID=A0ABQ9GS54_9NEOP|nr:hypothetical protein PR048_022767 [Dryococelus australis]
MTLQICSKQTNNTNVGCQKFRCKSKRGDSIPRRYKPVRDNYKEKLLHTLRYYVDDLHRAETEDEGGVNLQDDILSSALVRTLSTRAELTTCYLSWFKKLCLGTNPEHKSRTDHMNRISSSGMRNARLGNGRSPIRSALPTPLCESLGAAQPGVEPSSPRWEASSLTPTPPRPPCINTLGGHSHETVDLPCRSRLVRRRSGVWEAMGSNPGSGAVWVALENEVLKADEGETRCNLNSAGMQRLDGTGDPRENPPTSGIVRRDSYVWKSEPEPSVYHPDVADTPPDKPRTCYFSNYRKLLIVGRKISYPPSSSGVFTSLSPCVGGYRLWHEGRARVICIPRHVRVIRSLFNFPASTPSPARAATVLWRVCGSGEGRIWPGVASGGWSAREISHHGTFSRFNPVPLAARVLLI